MSISDQAAVYYEAAQSAVAMVELDDSGDNTFFESDDNFWSKKDGFAPVVRPDGVINGFAITPTGSNDEVAIAAGQVFQTGVQRSISATASLAIARPTTNDFKIVAVTLNSSQTVVAVEGTEGTSFSGTVGAAGGPPYVPEDSILLGHVQLSAQGAAAITSSEIKQIQGSSLEKFNYPLWSEKTYNVSEGVLGKAGVEFLSALPLIHTGDTPKKVYASYYTPEFSEIVDANNFTPPETTHSTTSTQVYGRTIGGSSETLNQASFEFYPEDGISDAIFQEKNNSLFFKFKQNRLSDPYLIQQGKFGISRNFPSDDLVIANATISAVEPAVEVITV